jgi:hypothetical protein
MEEMAHLTSVKYTELETNLDDQITHLRAWAKICSVKEDGTVAPVLTRGIVLLHCAHDGTDYLKNADGKNYCILEHWNAKEDGSYKTEFIGELTMTTKDNKNVFASTHYETKEWTCMSAKPKDGSKVAFMYKFTNPLLADALDRVDAKDFFLRTTSVWRGICGTVFSTIEDL